MKKVVMFVLDAAEPSLIEKWMDAGDLPNLKRLRERSASGRMISYADWLSESIPFAFYTGQNPATHGVHCPAIWDPHLMKLRPPTADWMPISPFWRKIPAGGPKSVVLDVANGYALEPFNGVEVLGWATHDALIPFSAYPPKVGRWVRKKYGASLLPDEMYDVLSKKDFINEMRLMTEISKKFSGLCIDLMKKYEWDFFLAYLFTAHHGGHRLWNTSCIAEPLTADEKTLFEDALRRVYIEADEALGKVIDQIDPRATLMVMSMHGMGVNNSLTWILPEMLRLVTEEPQPEKKVFLQLSRLRALIPVRWRHRVKSMLPYAWRRRLTRFWRDGYDWSKTKAFALTSDTHGWVRINLKGREAGGIVDAADYNDFCGELTRRLMTFVDADTGERVIDAIARADQLYQGEKLSLLPDLIIRWAETPAASRRAVTSPEFGTIPWPTPGSNPEGRSGNHRPDGFFMMAGEGIKSGNINSVHILDIAPTILHLLGQPVMPGMEGRVFPFLTDQGE